MSSSMLSIRDWSREPIRQRMAAAGLDPMTSTPEEQAAYLKADIAKFKRVIDFAGVKPG